MIFFLCALVLVVPLHKSADSVCCSVLQCVAVCCSVLECVGVCWSVLECVAQEYEHSCEVAQCSCTGNKSTNTHMKWHTQKKSTPVKWYCATSQGCSTALRET